MQNLSLTTSEHKDYQGHLIPDQKNSLVHQVDFWNFLVSIGVPN